MCEWGNTVAKRLPDFVQQEVQRINMVVDIDSCMVSLVDELWAAGVVTRSMCCGHGKGRADVLVFERDAAKAHEICAGRSAVSYWQLDELREIQ